MMLADQLDNQLFDICIYEQNYAPARKFLVAGDGGFNLTHSEELEQFITRYTPSFFLEKSIRSFSNTDLCDWLDSIGIKTFSGTSKRIFPLQGIKPIEVLNAILKQLDNKRVQIKTQYTWQGWDTTHQMLFDYKDKMMPVTADIVVFSMGGVSWSKTGSDGKWSRFFEKEGIEIIPFQASNCAYKVEWNKLFLEQAEGKSLKNISIACNGKEKKGEIVITQFGMEGPAIYALSPQIREQLNKNGTALIYLDLKPSLKLDEIKNRLKNGRGNKSVSKHIQDQLKLNAIQIALVKTILTKEEFTDTDTISYKIKHMPIYITDKAPIDDAISTVGGVSLNEIDENFQLKKLKNHYAIGEMLDWDAPTGGYLLQACFSMGASLARHLNTL